jgi:two-component system, NarL family, response regulator LiaR
MPAHPVRLAIASPDDAVATGLRRMLAEHTHRVVVVDEAGGGADVVLHDADGPGGEPRDAVLLRTGAVGWVPLRTGVERLVSMVEEAAAGRPVTAAPGHTLSAREVQVLALIAEGLTNQEIADRVFVSINSVKTYVRSAYRKIGVNSRSQAAVWCLNNGIVTDGRRTP